MARYKEFDEDQALGTALKVFWEKGYGDTSMQDLEQSLGLKRTSIYNAFGNKRSLFKKALSQYVEQVQHLLRTTIEGAQTSREAIKKWFEAVIDMQFNKDTPRGCLVILSVLESSQHDAETREMSEQLFQTEQQIILKVLQDGVRRGELSEEFDCEGVATAITAAVSGLVVLATAQFPVAKLHELVHASMKLLEE